MRPPLRTAVVVASVLVAAVAAIVPFAFASDARASTSAQDTADAPARPTGPPIAAADELDDLKVDVKRVDEASSEHGTSIVEIEVRNRGERHVEPLRFRITPKDRDATPIEVARVSAPVFGRAGRLIAPKKRERFRVLVHASKKELARAKAEVIDATAWDDGAPATEIDVDDGDVRVGRAKVTREQYQVRTSVELTNRSDWPLDIVLEARFQAGGGGTTQYRVRLAANESRVETFDSVPGSLGDRSDVIEWETDLDRIDVVDWSAIVDDGSTVARDALEAAWDGWIRAAEGHFPLSAKVRADIDLKRQFSANGGRFDFAEVIDAIVTVESDGTFRLARPDGSEVDRGRSTIEAALRNTLLHVARPTFTEIADAWSIELVHVGPSTRVRLDNVASIFSYNRVDVVVEDGAIVRVIPPGSPIARANEWTTVGESGAWRVMSTVADLDSQGLNTGSITYAAFDGVPDTLLPDAATFDEEAKLVDAPERVELTFTDWRARTATIPPPKPPTGPLADRLRTAWARHHRLATDATEVRGRFVVTSAGTDGVWIGRRKVEGTFALTGASGHFWNHSTCAVDDEKATATEREILVGAFEDRLLMWSGRDPCRWAPFDEAFAGAELRAADDGWIEVTGVRHFGAVRIDDGRVVAWRTPQGIATSLTWSEKGGVLLPRTITRPGNGRATLAWKEVADGVWFPTRIELEEYFGADWDPETLEFEVESITPPK